MFEYELVIDKPVRDVYRAFNDPDNMPRWLTGFQRLEPISGKPGEVGSKSRQVYLERGRTVELIETITLHEPEKRFVGEIEGQGMKCAIHVDFIDLGQRTKVRMRSDLVSRSFLMSLILPFIRGSVRKRQAGDLERFKRMVETGEAASGPEPRRPDGARERREPPPVGR